MVSETPDIISFDTSRRQDVLTPAQIKTVQVENTRSRKYLETSVVEYELTAVMTSDNQE